MKKTVCFLLSFVMLILPFFCVAQAADVDVKNTEYFDDGSYLVVETGEPPTSEDVSIFAKLIEFFRRLIELFTGNKTVTKTKYASYYDSKGALLWSVYLTAEFSYNGKTAKCKSSAASYDVYDSDWKVTSAVSSKEGNTANADFTVQQTKLGVKLKTVTKRLMLTCDEGGEVV